MKTLSFISEFLKSKQAYLILWVLNVAVGCAVFTISSQVRFPDAMGYWLMGESILEGKFSSWYFLPKYYPETLRTPGYPMFLALCQLVSDSLYIPKIIQLLTYFFSVFLCTRIIHRLHPQQSSVNLFLLLLVPNVQVVYYTGYLSGEILTVFFVVLAMHLFLKSKTMLNALLLAMAFYGAFIMRPAVLLFPFVLVAFLIFRERKLSRYAVVFVLGFVVLLVPFGLWNKANHGVFKVTPIEGGAGVAHFGVWQLKLPDGYTEKFYWGNNTMYDMTKPLHFTESELQENVEDYERECEALWNELEDFKSSEDSIQLEYMRTNNPGIFPLHNSRYTLEREKQLWKLVIGHIKSDPVYYFKTRIYHVFRFYVTGINGKDWSNAESLLQKVKVIYPFLVTSLFIFIGLLFLTIRLGFIGKNRLAFWSFILLFWYFGVVHLPFGIQARYTIPVHLLILSLLSVSIVKTFSFKHE